jgi:hypothetical protein
MEQDSKSWSSIADESTKQRRVDEVLRACTGSVKPLVETSQSDLTADWKPVFDRVRKLA